MIVLVCIFSKRLIRGTEQVDSLEFSAKITFILYVVARLMQLAKGNTLLKHLDVSLTHS
jgi:hypothetical protein